MIDIIILVYAVIGVLCASTYMIAIDVIEDDMSWSHLKYAMIIFLLWPLIAVKCLVDNLRQP